MTDAEKYFKKLEKLIKSVPKGLMVRYDYMSNELYVAYSDAEFNDTEDKPISAIIGSTTPQNGRGYGGDVGYDRDSVVGSIGVDMEAKQN